MWNSWERPKSQKKVGIVIGWIALHVWNDNTTDCVIGAIKFTLNVLSSGEFELRESGEIVASGQIKASNAVDKELLNLASPKMKKDEYLPLESTEVYKELRLKGYDYKNKFRGIQLIDNIGKKKKKLNPKSRNDVCFVRENYTCLNIHVSFFVKNNKTWFYNFTQ